MSQPPDGDPDPPACPICGRPARPRPLAPFCSRRCAEVDLGRWFSGAYAIAADEEAPYPPDQDPLP